MRRAAAFTLIELLIVLVILALLAAVLMPVFRAVRESANRTVCASNFKQAALAAQLYTNDYDDRFMPINHAPGVLRPDPQHDRTWVQLLLPYVREFKVFECPSDTGRTGSSDALFDEDLVPGDTYSRYYTASMRSNIGFNYMYLSPVARPDNMTPWGSRARSSAVVANPSQTIMFTDSVWDLNENGRPYGGGSFLVTPPCRMERLDGQMVDSFSGDPTERLFFSFGFVRSDSHREHYGNVWGWHRERVNVARIDGSTKSYRMSELTAGCEMSDNWRGVITSRDQYAWDFR